MRIVINALSATNLSSWHVLLGHLRQISKWTRNSHEYIVLYSGKNKAMRVDMGSSVKWVQCPIYTGHWTGRALWEHVELPNFLSKTGADIYFTPSGATTSSVRIPQICFAQNPWFLVHSINRSFYGKLKSAIQRANYKRAMSEAALMVFLSKHLREAYRENAGFVERNSEIAYAAISEETHAAAARDIRTWEEREPSILAVSVMAHHKNIETLLRAVDVLKQEYHSPAQLFLVGPWADVRYKHKVERLIKKLDLGGLVEILGYVTRKELNDLYASAKVFCLMSKCESFGIPAVEAQAFGTPVVSSRCCAIPEVCGEGGIYPEPDDVNGVAEALHKLIIDKEYWGKLSEAARQNAAKYRWDERSKPLLKMFDIIQ